MPVSIGSEQYTITYCKRQEYFGGVPANHAFGIVHWRGQSRSGGGTVADLRSIDRLFHNTETDALLRAATVKLIRAVETRPLMKFAWQQLS